MRDRGGRGLLVRGSPQDSVGGIRRLPGAQILVELEGGELVRFQACAQACADYVSARVPSAQHPTEADAQDVNEVVPLTGEPGVRAGQGCLRHLELRLER